MVFCAQAHHSKLNDAAFLAIFPSFIGLMACEKELLVELARLRALEIYNSRLRLFPMVQIQNDGYSKNAFLRNPESKDFVPTSDTVTLFMESRDRYILGRQSYKIKAGKVAGMFWASLLIRLKDYFL